MRRTDVIMIQDTSRNIAVPALQMMARALPALLDASWIENPPDAPVSDVMCVVYFHRACLLLARPFFRPPGMQYHLEDALRDMKARVPRIVYSRLFVQVRAVWDVDGYGVEDGEDQRLANLTHDRAELWMMHAENAEIFTPLHGNVALHWRDRRMALVMATHARLGAGSGIHGFGDDVFRIIMRACEADRLVFWDDFIPL